MEAVLVPQPLTMFIDFYSAGGEVRVIGAVAYRAKTCGADHNTKKLCLHLEFRGQSHLLNIHAVHAERALLPSNP